MDFYQPNYGEEHFIKEARESLPAEGGLIIQATITKDANGEIQIKFNDPLMEGFHTKISEEVKDQIKLNFSFNSEPNHSFLFIAETENSSPTSKLIVLSKILPSELLNYFTNNKLLKTLKISQEYIVFKDPEIYIRLQGNSDIRRNGPREELYFSPYSFTGLYLNEIIRSASNKSMVTRMGLFQKILINSFSIRGQVIRVEGYQWKLIYLFPLQNSPKN